MNKLRTASDGGFNVSWPQLGDLLVTDDGEKHFLAQTHFSGDWEAYVAAYRKAAEILAERSGEEVLWLNLLVFPIVFLYRHYLELRLKTLIQDANLIEGKSSDHPHEHELLKLWAFCRPSIERLLKDCSKTDLDAVEQTLGQFDGFDLKSMAARYPTIDKVGTPSGLLDLTINVKSFAETMTKTANFLDSLADVFDQFERSD